MDHDNPEEILSFTFDHLYACHTDNVNVPSDNILNNIQNEEVHNELIQLTNKTNNLQKENSRLKELILIHLDLIQQQSDEIIQKDKEILAYQQELEKYKASTSQPVNENNINFGFQDTNTPPLIHFNPANGSPSVAILPLSKSQMQVTNLAGLISPSGGVENIATKKVLDKKRDTTDSLPYFSNIQNKDTYTYGNIGPLIDTHYLQCGDNSFEPQQHISIQSVLQSVAQPPISTSVVQPIAQTSTSSIVQPIHTLDQPDNISNVGQVKTIPVNKASHSQPSMKAQEKKVIKTTKSTDCLIQKETSSKVNENNLNMKKTYKTIYSSGKSPKKSAKKCKNVSQYYCDSSKKMKETHQKAYPNTLEESSCSRNLKSSISNSYSKSKTMRKKFPIFDMKKAFKSGQSTSTSSETVSDTVTNSKVVKQEKSSQPRKFFTSGVKEKASCRDFSYGENYDNIKYVKADVLEYLEGSHSNNQNEIELLESDDKFSSFLAKLLNSTSSPIINLSTLSDNTILNDSNLMTLKMDMEKNENEKNVILENEPIDDTEKIDLYEFQSSEEYDASNQLDCNLLFMGNFMSENNNTSNFSKVNKARNFRMGNTSLSSNPDSNMSQQLVQYKSNPSKKKNVQRKRALSSASKISNLSHGDSSDSYSWTFSGQDFKILFVDIKSSYFVSIFGGNNSYFSLENISPLEQNVSESTSLEVPSWRIKSYTPDQFARTSENTDEEVYLKRHLKMEIEEKRRKRWDFQMIREQRLIEKLKLRQERRNSSGFKHSKSLKYLTSGSCNENLPSSFYPSPDDLLSIEITDKLPITAFGECIPDLPPRPFQLPWIRSHSHCHPRVHSSGKRRLKSEKSEEE